MQDRQSLGNRGGFYARNQNRPSGQKTGRASEAEAAPRKGTASRNAFHAGKEAERESASERAGSGETVPKTERTVKPGMANRLAVEKREDGAGLAGYVCRETGAPVSETGTKTAVLRRSINVAPENRFCVLRGFAVRSSDRPQSRPARKTPVLPCLSRKTNPLREPDTAFPPLPFAGERHGLPAFFCRMRFFQTRNPHGKNTTAIHFRHFKAETAVFKRLSRLRNRPEPLQQETVQCRVFLLFID